MSRPVGSKNKRKPVKRVSKPVPVLVAEAATEATFPPAAPAPMSWRYAAEANLDFHQGRIVELVTHWSLAGGVADLRLAADLLEHMIATRGFS